MRFKTLVGIGLIVFSTSVGTIMFVGLVLISPSQQGAGLGLLGGAGLPAETNVGVATGQDGGAAVNGTHSGSGGAAVASSGATTPKGTTSGSYPGSSKTPTPVPGTAGTPAPTGGTKTPTPTATP